MKKEIVTTTKTFYTSDHMPDIRTSSKATKEVIEWADANPFVWHIVTHNKSKAFGRDSCFYIGWAQKSMAPEAILERIIAFYDEIHARDYRNSQIWSWRARFTFSHYEDKGFTGGFFQQWDGKYPRNCLTLDYTPETLESVIDKFVEWAGSLDQTRRITIDSRTVREFGGKK